MVLKMADNCMGLEDRDIMCLLCMMTGTLGRIIATCSDKGLTAEIIVLKQSLDMLSATAYRGSSDALKSIIKPRGGTNGQRI